METVATESASRNKDTQRAMEVGIRLALVAGLVVWCFEIVRPFLSTIVWAMIIAAALFPAFRWFRMASLRA